MAYQPTCLVCQKVMELGFMTDFNAHASVRIPRWCPGEPENSFWSSEVSASQAKQGVKVVAYRCPECKALRLYAPDEPTQ